MANVIRHKRGTSDPAAGDFSNTAELLINTTDGGLFTKTDGGSVVEIGAGGGGGAAELNDLSDAKTDNTGAAIGIGSGTLAADDGTNITLAIGKDALNDQTSGVFNLGLGNEALSKVTTSSQNVAVGVYAGRHVPGSSNTFVGYSAGEGVSGTSSSSCSYNTGVGEKSFEFITTGLRNTGLGYRALRGVTTGQNNTAIGHLAGYSGANNLTTGGNNTIIGYNASASSATVSNEITLGNSSVTSLRCNTQTISSLSDVRDKTDIHELPEGLAFIEKLNPVKFKWQTRDGNGKDGTYEAGFIAQELQASQIDADADYLGLVMDNNPDRLEASYGKLVPILVKAIQELNSELNQLKADGRNPDR